MTETTKSKRISGQEAGSYIKNLQLFHNSGSNHRHPKGSTLWSEWQFGLYVVYSYGRHWPLLTNWMGIWFANTEKSSRTTNRHRGYVNPGPAVPMDCADMRCLVDYGPKPEHMVMAAKLKLLSDERLIAAASAIRIGG